MKEKKVLALVAHDNKKGDLVEWVEWNHGLLMKLELVCTGTTGQLVQKTLKNFSESSRISPWSSEKVTCLKSGPLGGDQQLGAMIVDGKIDLLIFFWDPMEPHPHDVDVKALLRIAVTYNIPTACNRSTADFLISSPLLNDSYTRKGADFSAYEASRENLRNKMISYIAT